MMKAILDKRFELLEAELAVEAAEFKLRTAEQLYDAILNTVEQELFRGAMEELRDTRAGYCLLDSTLGLLEVWHNAVSLLARADEDLTEKQAGLKQLLSL